MRLPLLLVFFRVCFLMADLRRSPAAPRCLASVCVTRASADEGSTPSSPQVPPKPNAAAVRAAMRPGRSNTIESRSSSGSPLSSVSTSPSVRGSDTEVSPPLMRKSPPSPPLRHVTPTVTARSSLITSATGEAPRGSALSPVRAVITSPPLLSPKTSGGGESPRLSFSGTRTPIDSPRLLRVTESPRPASRVPYDSSFEPRVQKRVAEAHLMMQSAMWALGEVHLKAGGLRAIEVIAKVTRTSDDPLRFSYKAGDTFRVLQQVRDEEWQCSSGQKTGIINMTDFCAVHNVPPSNEILSMILSGNPYWTATVYGRGLSQAWKRSFISNYLSAFEQQGEVLNMLRHVASYEIAHAVDGGRLFADTSLATQLFSEFALRSCRRFLSQVLDPTLNVVLALDLEVEPTKLAPTTSVAKAVGKVLKVVVDLVDRVRLVASTTFAVILRLFLRHVEKETAAKFGMAAALEVPQRLLFGHLMVMAICEDDLMQNQQQALPDHDWRRSRVILVEFLRSISLRIPLRKHQSVCDIVEPQRASLQDMVVAATRSAVQGATSSLDDVMSSIVEQLGHKPETQEQVAKVWLSIHRIMSLHRDRIANCLAELETATPLGEDFDPRRFRSILERMGPPGGILELPTANEGEPGAPVTMVSAPLFKTLRKGGSGAMPQRSSGSVERSSSGNLGDGISAFQVEQEAASALSLSQRLAAFREQADNSVLMLFNCALLHCPDLSRLTSVTTLNLSQNRITSLPACLFQMTALEALDLSNNLLERLPFRSLTGMPRLALLNLSGNPLPSPLNFITSGVSAVDTLHFLRHVDEFVLVYKASTGEILAGDKNWPLVEGVLRSIPTKYLVEWSSFAIDYHLHQATMNNSRGMSTPRFGRFLNKQKSTDKVLSVETIFDKQVLTFGYAAKDLVPVFKRVKCSVTINNVTGAKLSLTCHAPVTRVAEIEVEPKEFSVAKGKSAILDVYLTFVCTTTLQEVVRVQMEPLGLTVFLWVVAQSSLSFELDAKEIEIGEKIGSGGAATVFKGKWRGMTVACKRVMRYTEDDEGIVEAQMLCQLRHFNILVFYGIARQDGFSTIVTEHIELGSLHRVLGDATIDLPWWLRTKFAIDTADALRYLHGKKIMHRDLVSG